LYYMTYCTFPFNDFSNTNNPDMNQIFQSIMSDDPKFLNGSLQLQDIICQMLNKNEEERPNVNALLNHKWFRS